MGHYDTGSFSEEKKFCITTTINKAAGSHNINVFKVHGSVQIIEQIAEIKRAGTLTNCTAVYADLYDGTNTVDLTESSTGATLSGAPVGSVFTRDQDSSNAYTVALADECRLTETANTKQLGYPFIVTQKNGADTYIRFNFTTTDDPIDFDMHIRFVWRGVDGGYLTLA